MASSSRLVAFVTGGASGLGLGTVRRFVAAGYQVMIGDLAGSGGEKIVEELGADKVAYMNTDVRDEHSVKSTLAGISGKFGRLDVAVNCAGVAVAYKLYNFRKSLPHELKSFADVLETNTTGTFNVARLSAGLIGANEPRDADGSRGCIVMTSSIAAYDGQMGQVAYAASKGAVAAMTLPMARDLSLQGIRVVTVAPGLFSTPLLQSLPEKVVAGLCTLMAHPRRLGLPEEFGQTVLDIVNNPMMNGTVVRLDAGLRMTM